MSWYMWTKKTFFCKKEDYWVEWQFFISAREIAKRVLLLNIDLQAVGNAKNEYMLACFVFKSEMYWQFLVCMSDNFPVQLDAQHISAFIFASGPARLGELASSPFIFSFLPRQPGNVGRWCFCKSLTNCFQHFIFSWVWFLWDLFSEEWNHQWPQVHTE